MAEAPRQGLQAAKSDGEVPSLNVLTGMWWGHS